MTVRKLKRGKIVLKEQMTFTRTYTVNKAPSQIVRKGMKSVRGMRKGGGEV
jgi:hypothetical protein